MELLIDIGNTNCSIVVADKTKIRKRYFIHTGKKEVQPSSLRRLLGAHLRHIDSIVVVSVVPKFLTIVKKNLKDVAPGIPVKVVGRDIKVPMKIKYKDPGEVGQDRLVTAYAAARIFGTPVLTIDFGTAVTMDYVSGKGDYEGGLIFPGLRLATGSLSRKAALLPKIELKPAKDLIGRDTVSSMNNGILYGYASMCDGLIERFRKRYGKEFKIVATGGDAALVSRYSRHMRKVYPDLIPMGLSMLAR
jgi:type III pantothenate kinase